MENYHQLSSWIKEEKNEYINYLDRCNELMVPPKASGIVWNWVLDGNIELGGYSLGDKFTQALADGIKDNFQGNCMKLNDNRLTDIGMVPIL